MMLATLKAPPPVPPLVVSLAAQHSHHAMPPMRALDSTTMPVNYI